MFLLIDNFDSFTFNLVQTFAILGNEPLVLRNDRQEILELAQSGKLSRVCISPGPGKPDDAGYCLNFLELLPAEVPVLGVCLGHQTLGQSCGAKVVKATRIMHGKTSMVHHNNEGIFAGISNPFEVCRYHSLVVDPLGAESEIDVIAHTDQHEVMGIKCKNSNRVGVQFHPESILTPEGKILLNNFLEDKI